MSKMEKLSITVAFVIFLNLVVDGDTLLTKSGSQYEGTVTKEGNDYILVTLKGGQMRFPQNMVEKVIFGPIATQPAPTVTTSPKPVTPSSQPSIAATQPDAAKNRDAKPEAGKGKPDTSKVFVIVEAPANAQQIKRPVEEAMTAPRMVGEPLGGLTAIMGTDPKKAPADATVAGAGALLEISVTNRTFSIGTGMINYKLAANYTIFVPDGSGWKQRCSGKLETSGSEAGAGSKNDCDYLTDMLGAILIKQLFPYKSALNQNKLETTIKNTSQVAIKKLTLSLPPSAKYLFQMVSWASTSIAPGEEKKVEFPVTTANMQNGVISEIDFESRGEAASPATAKSPQPSRAPMTSKTSCKP